MSSPASVPTTRPGPGRVVAAILLVTLVAIGAALTSARLTTTTVTSTTASSSSSSSSSSTGAHRREPPRALGAADGAVPDGTTAFADDVPGVANLDPALLAALRRATEDAADDGVTLRVNSGWRSPAYQEQLLRDAVAEHGSEEEAARWVATAETSAHVSGDAVDVGPSEAAAWLAEHGAGHGLCRVYDNEPWHFELRPEAVAAGCPRPYADPTEDPRMQP